MNRTDEIPPDLAGAVQVAAHAAPPYTGDLAVVRGRGRAYRQRRIATTAGLAALAAAVAITVPVAISGPAAPPAPGADPPVGSSRAAAEPAEPAQRLLTDSAGFVLTADGTESPGAEEGETPRETYERLRQIPGAVGVVGGLAEVRPDGQLVPIDLDLPGIDSVREVVPMPDGRLAAIGVIDHLPGVEREDGPCVAGVDFPLLVVETDGSVSVSRDVHERCQTLELVAADAETAYLVRDSQLVAHDLATGRERVLLDSAEALGAAGNHAVASGRVATITDRLDGCPPGIVVRVAEFDTGVTSEHPVPEVPCGGLAGRMRLSPDGRYAAFSYLGGDERQYELRLAVVDLDTGELVVDRPVVGGAADDPNFALNGYAYSLTSTGGAIAGLAWDDERTLRMAWYEAPAQGVHWLGDVIHVTTMTVP
jgi:hypothetical protein